MNNKSVQVTVADQIKDSGPQVEAIIVSKLVGLEIEKRSGLVISGLSKLNDLQREFNKFNKPDVEVFTSPGVKGEGTYSKARSEEIINGQAKVKKLSDAIDLALEKNDGDSYGKLSEILK